MSIFASWYGKGNEKGINVPICLATLFQMESSLYFILVIRRRLKFVNYPTLVLAAFQYLADTVNTGWRFTVPSSSGVWELPW